MNAINIFFYTLPSISWLLQMIFCQQCYTLAIIHLLFTEFLQMLKEVQKMYIWFKGLLFVTRYLPPIIEMKVFKWAVLEPV